MSSPSAPSAHLDHQLGDPSGSVAVRAAADPQPAAQPGAPAARRPALDGIRALAVAAVAVYHFGGGDSSWLPGGYLGVDVFFVLSGYLITGLLLSEYQRHGRVDLVGFWVRRLRRLAPALLLVLLVVLAWIWYATPPDAYPRRRSDVFWTVGYLANWHLITTSDTYFAGYSSASPLRHAWSLAVEEQFYLVWPATVLALMWLGSRAVLWRFTRQSAGPMLVGGLAVVGALGSARWMADNYNALYPSRAYYATQGRVQELFVGVLLAVALALVRRRLRAWPTRGARWVTGIAVAGAGGLVGLLAALVLLRDSYAFYYTGGALCVCLVAAALIAGVELQPSGRLAGAFGWRPAVALGRISYGVYLWHWPIVVAVPVFGSWSLGQQVFWQGVRVALTLALATASYHLLEQPVLRSRRVFRSPRRVLGAAVAASALVLALAIPATALPGTLATQLSASSDRACPGERLDLALVCTWPAGADTAQRPVRLALLGDSTGRALSPGLDAWAEATGSTWVQAAWKRCTAAGAMVLPGVAAHPDLPARTCHDQGPGLIAGTLQAYRPPLVLVAEYWANNQAIQVDGRRVEPGAPAHAAALEAGWRSVVDQVARYGGRVVFLELPPPGRQLGREVAAGRPAGTARAPVVGEGAYVAAFNAAMRRAAATRPGVASTVSVTDVVCPGGTCSATEGGLMIRNDGVHYSIPFAQRLVPVLMQRIAASS